MCFSTDGLCTILNGRTYFIRCLKVFLRTSRPLLLVGDWNATLDTNLWYVGRYSNRRGCKCLKDLFKCFQMSDRYRLDHPNVTMWLRSHRIGSSILYLDRIFCRIVNIDSVGYLQFYVVSYTNHKFVTCTNDLKETKAGSRVLSASFPARQAY